MISRLFSTLVPALAAAAILASPAFAQDKAKAAAAPTPAKPATPIGAPPTPATPITPGKGPITLTKGEEEAKVLVENDKVRVTETRYKPGASSAMRERGVRVTRALTDGTMERTLANGKKETIQWKAGDVKYQAKETFANRNVGKAEVVLYTVTLK